MTIFLGGCLVENLNKPTTFISSIPSLERRINSNNKTIKLNDNDRPEREEAIVQ